VPVAEGPRVAVTGGGVPVAVTEAIAVADGVRDGVAVSEGNAVAVVVVVAERVAVAEGVRDEVGVSEGNAVAVVVLVAEAVAVAEGV
jgi:hypothetical protein